MNGNIGERTEEDLGHGLEVKDQEAETEKGQDQKIVTGKTKKEGNYFHFTSRSININVSQLKSVYFLNEKKTNKQNKQKPTPYP